MDRRDEPERIKGEWRGQEGYGEGREKNDEQIWETQVEFEIGMLVKAEGRRKQKKIYEELKRRRIQKDMIKGNSNQELLHFRAKGQWDTSNRSIQTKIIPSTTHKKRYGAVSYGTIGYGKENKLICFSH